MISIIKYFFLSILFSFQLSSQWIQQNSGTSQRLQTIFFLNSNEGWVAGSDGTILKTVDGGINWVSKSVSTLDDIHSIFFIDSLNGWAAFYEYDPMRHGSIIHTTDGGNNWSLQYTIYDVVLHDVFFTDADNGYFVGSSGVLFKTTNGGQYWYNISPILGYWLYSCYLFDSKVGWFVGGLEGFLLRTNDGGQIWSYIGIPTNQRMMSVYFIDDDHGWTCGATGKILKTTNAGLDWLLGNTGVNVELRDICFVNQNDGWSVGINGTIVNSTNGGANWNQQYSGTSSNLYGVHFADASNGWVVGDNGIILRTNNGGIPVELISFYCEVKAGNIILKWETATELNNAGFEIERKTNNTDFITVGFLNGFGTTTEPKYYSFIDGDVQSGTYIYRLKQIDLDGTYEYSNEVKVDLINPTTYSLSQNYPNPFNPTTTIKYSIALDGFVNLVVYDVLGNEVKSLVNSYQHSGDYEVIFDGGHISSGIYYYQLQAGKFISIKKLILLK